MPNEIDDAIAGLRELRIYRMSRGCMYLQADAEPHLKALLAFADRAKAALEKIDSDNRVESGSPGPLYDAGFNFGWTCARTYAKEALNPEAKQ
jgi:hypothetical protein